MIPVGFIWGRKRRTSCSRMGISLSLKSRSIRPSMRVSRLDRKSTRLNSSHMSISYAVFCLKKLDAEKDTLIDHKPASGKPPGAIGLLIRIEFAPRSSPPRLWVSLHTHLVEHPLGKARLPQY